MSIADFSSASAAAPDPDDQDDQSAVVRPAQRLELRIQPCDGYTIINVWGELRAGTTDKLTRLMQTLVHAGCNRVLLDFSRLYDIDAEAITELTRWQNVLVTLSGGLWLAAPRPWVRRLLEYMCLRGTFTVYPTVLEALAEITPSEPPDAE